MVQIERQYNTPQYTNKRTLDFSPFGDFLLADDRRIELDDLLLNATIPDIQALFADGQLTSAALVRYYLDRIYRYDVNGYNSVIRLNPDVLDIAAECDAQREAGQVVNAMHGIPVLIKDNIGTGDKMVTAAGAYALRDSYCDRDAFIVQKLREAGAIILGKTNLSEWANFMSFDSSNGFSVLGGQTRNPYGKFDVGGSSSGSGSAGACQFATVTIGTETSGSLVSPASSNSLCTLKPSLGLVSRDRIIPITDKQDTAGPMTRSMTDLVHLLNAIAGVDDNDPKTHDATDLSSIDFTTLLDADALQGKRIGVINYDEIPEPFAGYREAIVEGLTKAGAEVVDVEVLDFSFFDFTTFFFGMHEGVNEYLKAIGSDLTLEQIVALNAEDLSNRAPFGQDNLELCIKTPINDDTRAGFERIHANNASQAAEALETAMDKHNLDALLDINNFSTVAYAASGYSGVCVPAGYLSNEQPFGATFYGRYLQDADLISYAYAYEQATQARKNPELVLASER